MSLFITLNKNMSYVDGSAVNITVLFQKMNGGKLPIEIWATRTQVKLGRDFSYFSALNFTH
jgi:hypothetical protein